MKSILFVAIMAIAVASCDTPQTTTGTTSDSTAKPNTTVDTTMKKPDTTKQQ